jgi:hypothetical protein
LRIHKTLPLLIALALLLAACSPTAPAENTDARTADQPVEAQDDTMVEESGEEIAGEADMADDLGDMAGEPEEMMETEEPDAMTAKPEEIMETEEMEAMPVESEDMMETAEPDDMADDMNGFPAYFEHTFTDARTGEPFKISDFQGKVILVETLAQWCSNCMKQQLQVYDLHQLLGERDDFISIGLDIDPNEDLASLNSYVKNNGFTWLYGVSPAEVSREIANLYGDQFLNPPSTPMLIIDRQGQAHELRFGIKNADELLAALEPFLAQ